MAANTRERAVVYFSPEIIEGMAIDSLSAYKEFVASCHRPDLVKELYRGRFTSAARFAIYSVRSGIPPAEPNKGLKRFIS